MPENSRLATAFSVTPTSYCNQLLENNGYGVFRDRTRRHFPGRKLHDPSTSAAFGDADSDGDLDLLVGNSTSINGEERLYIQLGCDTGRRCKGRWHQS
jgi:hypothetical protein